MACFRRQVANLPPSLVPKMMLSANVATRSAFPPSMQNMRKPLEAAPLAPLPEETTTVEGEDRTNLVDVRNPDEEVLMKFFQKFNT